MAKKVLTMIKLQIPAGAANPAPPVGPALGQHGVNIMEFCKAFNAQTQQDAGTIIPVEITVYEDRSFDFITKTPPAAVLIKEAARIDKGSGEPHTEKVGSITVDQARQIAERKMPDLNANDLDAATKIIAGTARSMGVTVEGLHDPASVSSPEEIAAARAEAAASTEAAAPARPPPRLRPAPGPLRRELMARGKRYREAYEKIDRTKAYEPAEAVSLIKGAPGAKFDETVELHIRLGVNVRHAEEQLRGTLALPRGLGKDLTVAVFAEGDGARQATEAGADHVGGDDLIEKVEEGWTDFDVAVATPALMPKVGKLGRVLGPQGKMPNPKVGTVTDDVAKAVGEAKAGKVEYRTDKQAIVHLSIGKTSFEEAALLENYAAVIEEIIRAKPAAAKGRYILSATLTSTMGPGVRVDTAKTRAGEIMAGAGQVSSNGAGEEPAANRRRPRKPTSRRLRPKRPRPPRRPRRRGSPARRGSRGRRGGPRGEARLATLPLRAAAQDRRQGRLPRRPRRPTQARDEQGTEDSRS